MPKVRATYTVGGSNKLEAVVNVDSVIKGQIEQAIAKSLGTDVRHIKSDRVQVIEK